MRARAAIFIFAAWPCFIHAQNSLSREKSPNFANGINENLIHLVPCVKNLGLSKCVAAYGVWRAEKSLEPNSVTEPIDSARFPWQRYLNTSNEELYTNLCDGVEKLLERRSLKLNLNENYSLQLRTTRNGSLNFDVLKSELISGRATKKMEKTFYELVPFMVLPGLLMSAVLPFFLPTLKMMTVGAGMLNHIALVGAVFTLLRNNAFTEHRYEKKVIYVNNGYSNQKLLAPLEDTSSDIIIDDEFEKFPKYHDKFAALDTKDIHVTDQGSLDDFGSEWLKPDNILKSNYIDNNWRKKYDVGKQTEWIGRTV